MQILKNISSSSKILKSLLIKAQKDVFSNIIGENITKIKGIGYDFIELREYASGDDVKHIDWTISSKLAKPYVKVFQEQRELNIVIVPILCASVNFGVKILKQDVMSEVCALLSFFAVKQNDQFSSYICNEDTTLNTKSSKLLFDVKELVEKVYLYETLSKGLSYKLLSSKLYTQLKQKSMIFLIGDFFNVEKFDITALSIKHELIIIILRDRFEEKPIKLGKINVIDPQTKLHEQININKKASLKIEKKLSKHDTLFHTKLKKAGVRFIKIYTDENIANKIISFMRSI